MKIEETLQEHCTAEERGEHVSFLHNLIREKLNLNNEIFFIGANKDCSAIAILFFRKESDGKSYQTSFDENGVYIIIEEE